MDPQSIRQKIIDKFGDDPVSELVTENCDPYVMVPPERLREIALFLRDESDLAFDYLMLVSGVDTGEAILSVYHVYSYEHQHALVLKCQLDRQVPEVDTLEDIWPAAEWHERECFDMMGIRYKGHHDLRRILCPDDWDGHPLRKDYEEPETYHGIPNK